MRLNINYRLGTPIPYGRGLAIPPKFSAVWEKDQDEEGGPDSLELELEVVDGKVVCTRLQLKLQRESSRPVNAFDVRLPMSQILRTVTAQAVMKAERHERSIQFKFPEEIDVSDLFEPRGHRRMTDEHLKEVARVYRKALKAGGNPTAAVHDAFGGPDEIHRSTAARWVGEARKRGFLPTTEPRKAKA